jgi:ABC-2 type transport system permease protein
MNNLSLLVVDELRGFYKSKVMIFLWIGLPLISILFRFLSFSSTGQDIPFTVVSALVVSSVGGTLAAVMLAVSIINEKNRHIYEIFLIRPVKRRDIILAKFLSVYVCVAIASLIAIAAGIIVDYYTTGTLVTAILTNAAESLGTSLSLMAVSCATGVLIGIAAPSVLVGAILVIYGGNQITVIPLIPTLLNLPNALAFTVAIAALLTATFLALAFKVFERKQF